MPSNAIRQRNSAGLQDAVDRLVGGLKQMIDKEASGSTIKLANATKQDEVVVKKLVSALSGPMPFAPSDQHQRESVEVQVHDGQRCLLGRCGLMNYKYPPPMPPRREESRVIALLCFGALLLLCLVRLISSCIR